MDSSLKYVGKGSIIKLKSKKFILKEITQSGHTQPSIESSLNKLEDGLVALQAEVEVARTVDIRDDDRLHDGFSAAVSVLNTFFSFGLLIHL